MMNDDYISTTAASPWPDSAPHTPLEQAPPSFMLHGSMGSSTSVCTTDDEDSETQYNWNEEQDAFLKQMLADYEANPRNAPFSGRFPPSGVVQRVARSTIRKASEDLGFYFPHNLIAVRKRIFLHCARAADQITPEDLPEGTLLPGTNGSMDDISEPMLLTPAKESSYDDFDFEDHTQPQTIPLASPFKEEFAKPHAINAIRPIPTSPMPQQQSSDLHALNIVAKRKRDSLKMKRGLQ